MKAATTASTEWRRAALRILAFARRLLPPVVGLLLTACAFDRYDPRPLSTASVADAYTARSLQSPELHEFIQRHYPRAAEVWPPNQWDLESLTLAALYFNPELEVSRSRLATTEAAVTTAAQRPNPTLQLPFQRTLNPKGGDSPWTLGIALDIPIETAGKRGYRIDEATHLSSAARFQVANIAWGVRNQLRSQLLNLWFASERTQLLQQQLELDQRTVAMLERRLAVGDASPWEVNQQRLMVMQAQTDLLAAQRQAIAARVQVAAVLGLRASALDTVDLDLTEFVQAYPALPSQTIRLQALLNRADVQAGLAQYEASQAALQLEVAKQYPNIHLGPGYTFDQGARKLGFDFAGLVLPVFNRNEGPIAEARSRRLEAEARVKQLEAQAFSETDGAIAAYQVTRDIVRQNEAQLAVQSRQLAATRRSFDIGQVDRLALTLAGRTELAARIALGDATFQMQQAVGRLEDAMQRPLTAQATGEHTNPERK
ncbi:TolC family protein [Cupriavidus sp. TMH.W2]|uniref:TolC family protein n=1 Tax=Cupriavidus sp. TMH.W2 TaxID=3434465 RepID=UPI003D76AA28